MKDKRLLDAVNEALANVMRRGSDEGKLLKAMGKYPNKYNFGDNEVRLEVKIFVTGGCVVISRMRDHGTSEPFEFEFHPENGGVADSRSLEYRRGRWGWRQWK